MKKTIPIMLLVAAMLSAAFAVATPKMQIVKRQSQATNISK